MRGWVCVIGFFRDSDLAAILIVGVLVPPAVVGGQAPPTHQSWQAPRTPEGHPDLQGVWSYATLTPLERPQRMADRTHLSDADAAEIAKQAENAPCRRERRGTASAGPGWRIQPIRVSRSDYGMVGILRGARLQETEAPKAGK